MTYHNALAVLGDPTRRRIVDLIGAKPMAVGQLAALLPITRPAVSQHLKLLKGAKLVREHAEGTRRIYSIDPAGLGAIRAWLDRFWEQNLAAFAEAAEREDKQ